MLGLGTSLDSCIYPSPVFDINESQGYIDHEFPLDKIVLIIIIGVTLNTRGP